MSRWHDHPGGFRQWFPEYIGERQPQLDPWAGCLVCGVMPSGDPEGKVRLRIEHDLILHQTYDAQIKELKLPNREAFLAGQDTAMEAGDRLSDMQRRIAAEHDDRRFPT